RPRIVLFDNRGSTSQELAISGLPTRPTRPCGSDSWFSSLSLSLRRRICWLLSGLRGGKASSMGSREVTKSHELNLITVVFPGKRFPGLEQPDAPIRNSNHPLIICL